MELKIKNLNNVKKNSYPDLHKDLCKPPFFGLLVGQRASGKSNLVKNLILRNEFYGKVFEPENIFYISSTVFIDDSCDDLPSDINKYDNYEPEVIESILEQCKEIKASDGKNEVPDILLIIDDLAAESKVCGRGGYMEKLSFISRHFNVSVFVLVQKYSSICRGVRNNSDYQFFFRPMNMGEIDHILQEHSDKHNRDKFRNMLEYVWAEPYNFLTICYKKPLNNGRYMKNFEEKLKLKDF